MACAEGGRECITLPGNDRGVHTLMALFPHAMRSTIALLAFSSILMFAGCKEEPKPQAPPEPPPAQPAPEGTTINVGDGGVEIQSEGGNVNVSSDSAHIQIKPK